MGNNISRGLWQGDWSLMILEVPSHPCHSIILCGFLHLTLSLPDENWEKKNFEVVLLPWFCQVKKQIFQIFAKCFYISNTCKRPEREGWKKIGHSSIAITMKLFFNKIKLWLNFILECCGTVRNGGLNSLSPAGKGNKFFTMLLLKWWFWLFAYDRAICQRK